MYPGLRIPTTAASWVLPCMALCVCVRLEARDLHQVSFSPSTLLLLCMGGGGRVDTCHGALVGIRGLWESVISFHCMNSGGQIQVVRLSGKHLSLLSHLVSPC